MNAMCREANQTIKINLITVCDGEKKKSLYSVHSQAIKTYVQLISRVYVRFCVCRATQSRRVRRRRTRRRLTALRLLCCVQVALASTAPVWGLIDAPVQSSTDKLVWKGTWLRGDEAGGRALSTQPKPPILPDPVSHKSHPPIPPITPAGSVSRLVEEYIPWLRVFGDVRRQTVEFLNCLGIYFLREQRKEGWMIGFKGKPI